MSIFKFLINKNDAPEAWQFGFQDPATPMAEGMISFHHYLMFFVIVIGIIVC
jgi:heme/copper-type cytochrome/quinol oxidase subunit 2